MVKAETNSPELQMHGKSPRLHGVDLSPADIGPLWIRLSAGKYRHNFESLVTYSTLRETVQTHGLSLDQGYAGGCECSKNRNVHGRRNFSKRVTGMRLSEKSFFRLLMQQ